MDAGDWRRRRKWVIKSWANGVQVLSDLNGLKMALNGGFPSGGGYAQDG